MCPLRCATSLLCHSACILVGRHYLNVLQTTRWDDCAGEADRNAPLVSDKICDVTIVAKEPMGGTRDICIFSDILRSRSKKFSKVTPRSKLVTDLDADAVRDVVVYLHTASVRSLMLMVRLHDMNADHIVSRVAGTRVSRCIVPADHRVDG